MTQTRPTIWRSTVHYGLTAASGAMLTFLLAAVLTRTLSVSEFGEYSLLRPMATFLAALVTLNLHGALHRYLLEPTDDQDVFRRLVLKLTLLSCTVVGLLGWAAAGLVESIADLPPKVFLAALAIAVARAPFQLLWKDLAATHRSARYMGYALARDVIVAVGVVVVVYGDGGAGIVGVIAVLLGAEVLIGVVGSVELWGRSAPGKASSEHWTYIAQFSAPVIPAVIATQMLHAFDRVLVNEAKGLEAAAMYGFAYGIGGIATVIATALNQAVTPVVVRELGRGDHTKLRGASVAAIEFQLAAGLGIILLQREGAALLGPDVYAESLYLVKWVVWGGFATFYARTLGRYLLFKRRTWAVAACSVAAASLNVALNLLYIPTYGLLAAAVSTTVSYAFLAVGYGAVVKHTDRSWTLFVWPLAPRYLFALAATVAIEWGVLSLDPWAAGSIALKAVIGLVLAAFGLSRRGKLR